MNGSGTTILLTGLPAAGKTTIAEALHQALIARGDVPFFTGLSDDYEAPSDVDMTFDTRDTSVAAAVSCIMSRILPP